MRNKTSWMFSNSTKKENYVPLVFPKTSQNLFQVIDGNIYKHFFKNHVYNIIHNIVVYVVSLYETLTAVEDCYTFSELISQIYHEVLFTSSLHKDENMQLMS